MRQIGAWITKASTSAMTTRRSTASAAKWPSWPTASRSMRGAGRRWLSASKHWIYLPFSGTNAPCASFRRFVSNGRESTTLA